MAIYAEDLRDKGVALALDQKGRVCPVTRYKRKLIMQGLVATKLYNLTLEAFLLIISLRSKTALSHRKKKKTYIWYTFGLTGDCELRGS